VPDTPPPVAESGRAYRTVTAFAGWVSVKRTYSPAASRRTAVRFDASEASVEAERSGPTTSPVNVAFSASCST
jgi:hypothetical protein